MTLHRDHDDADWTYNELVSEGMTIWEGDRTPRQKEAIRIALAGEEMLAVLKSVAPLGDLSLAKDIKANLRPSEQASFDEIISRVRAAIKLATDPAP